jgi:hypothetical protein
MITQSQNHTNSLYAGGLSEIVRKELGLLINDFRYAFTTYVLDHTSLSYDDKEKLILGSLHTMKTAIDEYYRPQ